MTKKLIRESGESGPLNYLKFETVLSHFKKIKNYKFLLFCLICSSCASRRTILVESDPPGADIELNEGFVGQTPLKLDVLVCPNGKLSEDINITATYPGSFVQNKKLRGYSDCLFDSYGYAVRAPATIKFNMGLGPAASKSIIDLNIHNSQ